VKPLAIIMIFVLILSVIATGWLLLSADVKATGTSIISTGCAQQAARFEELRLQVADQAVAGTAFTTSVPGDASDYKLVTYSVQLNNTTFMDAELVEMQITPRDGDVLQCGSDSFVSIAARSTGTVEATVLMPINAFTSREAIITYRLWGKAHTLRVTCNE